jgi:hypothetical protein
MHKKEGEDPFEVNLQRQHNTQMSIQPKQQMQFEIYCTCNVITVKSNKSPSVMNNSQKLNQIGHHIDNLSYTYTPKDK